MDDTGIIHDYATSLKLPEYTVVHSTSQTQPGYNKSHSDIQSPRTFNKELRLIVCTHFILLSTYPADLLSKLIPVCMYVCMYVCTYVCIIYFS